MSGPIRMDEALAHSGNLLSGDCHFLPAVIVKAVEPSEEMFRRELAVYRLASHKSVPGYFYVRDISYISAI